MTTPISRYVLEVQELRREVAALKRAFDMGSGTVTDLYHTHRVRLEALERLAGLTWDPREGSYR